MVLKVSSIFGLNFLTKITSDFPRKKNCVGIPYVLSKKKLKGFPLKIEGEFNF